MEGKQHTGDLVNVAADVERFIRQNFFYDGPPLAANVSLMDTGILDSTGVLEMVGYLEESFGIKIEDTDLTPENLDSLGRIAAFVEKKRVRTG